MLDWRIPRYLEQLRRTRRWLERIKDQNRQQDEYLDDLYAFFQSCWHLKDWIEKDGGLGPWRKNILDEIKNDDACKNIRICSVIANSTKHLDLDRSQLAQARVTGANVVMVVGESIAWNYVVDTPDGVKAAIEIGDAAVREWADILGRRGLQTE